MQQSENEVLNFEVRTGSVTMPFRVTLDLEAEGKICDDDSIFSKFWYFVLAYIQYKLKEFLCLQALVNVFWISGFHEPFKELSSWVRPDCVDGTLDLLTRHYAAGQCRAPRQWNQTKGLLTELRRVKGWTERHRFSSREQNTSSSAISLGPKTHIKY